MILIAAMWWKRLTFETTKRSTAVMVIMTTTKQTLEDSAPSVTVVLSGFSFFGSHSSSRDFHSFFVIIISSLLFPHPHSLPVPSCALCVLFVCAYDPCLCSCDGRPSERPQRPFGLRWRLDDSSQMIIVQLATYTTLRVEQTSNGQTLTRSISPLAALSCASMCKL